VIVSVKEVEVTNSGNLAVDWARWQREAIEKSCKQIYGAERWLKSASHVVRAGGTKGPDLPAKDSRRIHRVAVSLGSKGAVPFRSGDFGKGFVHVFTEASLSVIFSELDTISDFIAYLGKKETYLRSGARVRIKPGGTEKDLLALYLHLDRSFPDTLKVILVDDTLWRGLIA